MKPELTNASPDEGSFRVALVCTGNRFRSPLAEGFLRKWGRDLPVEVQSFGTRDIGAAPPLPEAFETAATYGLELDRHRARSLHGVELAEADLVLGFERFHVARSVVDSGAVKQRAFTLPEIVDLLAKLPPVEGALSAEHARRRVRVAHAARATTRGMYALPEMADPLGGPPAGYARIGSRLADLCRDLLVGLFGQPLTLDADSADSRRPSPRAGVS